MGKYRGLIRMRFRNLINSFIGTVLFVVVLLFFLVAYGSVIPNKWYRVLTVTSGSMAPAIQAGDAIVIKRPPPVEELKAGMIATFVVKGNVVTHRIHEIREGGIIITKGDANQEIDRFYNDQGSQIYLTEINGVYLFRIPYLGYLLKTPRMVGQVTDAWFNDAARVNNLTAGVLPFTPSTTPQPTTTSEPTFTFTPVPTETVESPPTETEALAPSSTPSE